MKDQSVENATGKLPGEWFELIMANGLGEAGHKEIADFLHQTEGMDYWWAQEVTVLYEKHIGRRVTGQTADGGFQIGVSRTYDVSGSELWEVLTAPGGLALIIGEEREVPDLTSLEGGRRGGCRYKLTTLKPYSHFRMQWAREDWPAHSILQVRITPKGKEKSFLTIHQEKLSSPEARAAMKTHWRQQLQLLQDLIPNREF